MATFTIQPVNIPANTLTPSAAAAVPSNITSATAQLSDGTGKTSALPANSDWLKTAGNVLQWGVQRSTDGGVNWSWYLYQVGLPFGSLQKDKSMPSLELASGDIIASQGDQVRLAIIVDTPIKLGAVITTQ